MASLNRFGIFLLLGASSGIILTFITSLDLFIFDSAYPRPSFLSLFIFSLKLSGINILYGLLCGALQGIIYIGWNFLFPSSLIWLKNTWRRLRPNTTPFVIALCAGFLSLLVGSIWLAKFATQGAFDIPDKVAEVLGLIQASLGLVSFLVAFFIFKKTKRLFFPEISLICLFKIVALSLYIICTRILSRFTGFEPFILLGSLGLIISLELVLFFSYLKSRVHFSLRSGYFIFIFGLLILSFFMLSRDHESQRLLLERSYLSRVLMSKFYNYLDLDGDGIAGLFGAGDCDDSNPRVYPGARDIPGNKIDENCGYGDSQGFKKRERKSFFSFLSGYDLIFITVDALRAKNLSLYGYSKPTSPNLHLWAKSQGILFESAYVQTTFSLLSFLSMMTASYPTCLIQGKKAILRPTLAEILGKKGYRRVAIHDLWRPRAYIYKGFEIVDSSLSVYNRSAERQSVFGASGQTITDIGLRFIVQRDLRPLFLWLHYTEPHAAYIPHPAFSYLGSGLIGRYDQEIASVDKAIGRFLKVLDKIRRPKPLVIITADHGESFGFHGTFTHGNSLYEEQIHVPLIIRVPGIGAKRISTPVELVDLVPTILELLDVKSGVSFQGESLTPFIVNRKMTRYKKGVVSELLHEGNFSRSFRLGRYKIIRNYKQGFDQLFDLKKDPRETLNIVDINRHLARNMRFYLTRFEESFMQCW